MRRELFNSLRWKLVVTYIVLAVLTVGIVGTLSFYFIARYAHDQERLYLFRTAEDLALQIQSFSPLDKKNRDRLQEIAQTMALLNNVQITILDPSRNVVAEAGQTAQVSVRVGTAQTGTRSSSQQFLEIQPLLERLFEERNVPPGRPGAPSPAEILLLRREINRLGSPPFSLLLPGAPLPSHSVDRSHVVLTPMDGEEPDGDQGERSMTFLVGPRSSPAAFIKLKNGPDFRALAIDSAQNAFVYSALAALAAAVVIGLFMGRQLTRPLHSLAEAAQAMGRQKWSIRVDEQGKDEIGVLARHFNTMAERLQASFTEISRERDTLRQFVQDASHQLRTPLTALASFTELLLTKPDMKEWSRTEFLEDSKAQIDKLSWIVSHLLDLSRLDAGTESMSFADHDVLDVLRTLEMQLRPVLQEKGLKGQFDAPPGMVHCDRSRVEMALGNLLDNAVKHAPPSSLISVTAYADRQWWRISVSDHGPGIPPEEQEHIFDRFWRSRRSTYDGTGLGLAIAASVARAHGGRIELESTPGEGSTFVMLIPRVANNGGSPGPV